ncbi:MAG: SBBP repeat-containing protein [Bacteroidota bacterium]
MKKRIFFSTILCITFLMSSYAQVNILWATRYTSSGNNIDKAEDMIMDAAGNTYVTGIGRGASGGFDYITIKYNSAGVQQWKSEYNGTGNGLDDAHAITIDASGNVYVTGWSNGGATTGFDYATVKYNSAGVQQWASRYNNTTNGVDEAWDIGVDNAGNVYVTGTSDGTAGNGSAATTVKYNSAGVQQNVVRYEGAGNGIDAGFAIYVEPVSGIVYIAGHTFRSTANDFDFVTIKYTTALVQTWAPRYNGPDSKYDEARAIAVDAAGNVYVTGYSQTTILTDYNYSTVKYNSAGTQQWARNYNGTGNDYDRANAIKLDAVGNVYVTGRSVGAGTDAEDIVTIKYNNGGTEKWTARYNGTTNGYDEGNALAVDATGNIYVSGTSFASASNNDYIVIKYDSTGVGTNGALQWIGKYNGTGNNTDQAVGVGVDAAGNVYVSGQSRGSGTNDDFATVKFCQFTANAGNDVAICIGTSTTLNASGTGAVSYSWTPATGLSNSTIFNPVATPTDTASYVVTITNSNGCVDIDTVVVNVVPKPVPTISASGPTTFCIGDSVILTASVHTSYQWNTSSTLQSIKAITSGTYSVTVANPTGCTGSATRSVTVNPLPVVNAGPDASICIGSSGNLLATGAFSYVWHYGTTLTTDSTIANPVANPVVTTTYTVVGTSSSGCVNSDDVRITVLPLPAVDAGLNNNVCSGSSVNLAGTGANTYAWSPASSLNNTAIANPSASPTLTTTYTLVGTGANGCTKSDAVKITVLPVPVIDAGMDDSICLGSTINLLATGNSVLYTWSPGNTLDDSTIFDPIATPVSTTTYTVTGTVVNGCTKSDVVKISVFAYPPATIYRGTDTLYCAQSGYVFRWYLNGALIPGANGTYYVFTQNGSYHVEVDNGGCVTASTPINVLDVGVNEIGGSASLAIYPNPATNDVTLEFDLVKVSNVKINLVNIAGQLVFTDDMNQFSGTYKKQINLQEHAKGIYYLQIITDERVINAKVVKQ